ncbi:MAG: nuclear transport factor 2 family protein [Myxococcota bacterium]
MDTLERFLAYAADFEKTLVDDDWERLERWFDDDAVYVVESQAFGCELRGPAAIFAGMKKSLDGLDRHFDSRDVDVVDGPKVEGDTLHVGWKITYHKAGHPDFVLEGASEARLRDGRIERLVDSYDEAKSQAALDAWSRETGIALDPSYT